MNDAVKSMNPGDWVEINHKLYSHIEITQDSDGYTFAVRSKRTKQMVYPRKGKTVWHEIKYWKTLNGARGAAIKFLEANHVHSTP